MIRMEILVVFTDKITLERAQEMREDLIDAFEDGKAAGDVQQVNITIR